MLAEVRSCEDKQIFYALIEIGSKLESQTPNSQLDIVFQITTQVEVSWLEENMKK
jgi:hypothetical protein